MTERRGAGATRRPGMRRGVRVRRMMPLERKARDAPGGCSQRVSATLNPGPGSASPSATQVPAPQDDHPSSGGASSTALIAA
jgi:hypothetical protein